MTKILDYALIFLGLAILVIALSGSVLRLVPLSVRDAQSPMVAPTSPHKLTIPGLDLELPVLVASISGVTWETSSRGVSYLDSSALPGEMGNTVIYGHNWPSILGKLEQITPGTVISLSMGDLVYNYQTTGSAEVDPSSTYITSSTVAKTLTLYTCSGFLDSKRFVVTARLIE